MTDERPMVVTNKTEIDFFWPCFLVLLILFWDEPDLMDALIHFLMRQP